MGAGIPFVEMGGLTWRAKAPVSVAGTGSTVL